MTQGGDRRSQRIEAEAAFILCVVAQQPDMTLAELKEKLRERGMSVWIGTLWRFFRRHRITLGQLRRARTKAASPDDTRVFDWSAKSNKYSKYPPEICGGLGLALPGALQDVVL